MNVVVASTLVWFLSIRTKKQIKLDEFLSSMIVYPNTDIGLSWQYQFRVILQLEKLFLFFTVGKTNRIRTGAIIGPLLTVFDTNLSS